MPEERRMVRGTLFADYVRMIRGFKGACWSEHLSAEDLAIVEGRVEPDAWYPMEVFERLGNAILATIAAGSLEAVRAWGRVTVDQLRAVHPELVAPSDPGETLARFHAFRRRFFDFDPIELVYSVEGQAALRIQYHMGQPAEQAASYQSMGFFERLLEVAGARDVRARFTTRAWEGEPASSLELRWRAPA